MASRVTAESSESRAMLGNYCTVDAVLTLLSLLSSSLCFVSAVHVAVERAQGAWRPDGLRHCVLNQREALDICQHSPLKDLCT